MIFSLPKTKGGFYTSCSTPPSWSEVRRAKFFIYEWTFPLLAYYTTRHNEDDWLCQSPPLCVIHSLASLVCSSAPRSNSYCCTNTYTHIGIRTYTNMYRPIEVSIGLAFRLPLIGKALSHRSVNLTLKWRSM